MASVTETRRQSLTVLATLVIGAVLLLLRAPSPAEMTASLHNDSAMRLVQVRDLMSGQPWYDLTQYRLGLEGGFEMHWSRLVDAPIAALLTVLTPLFGQAGAEYVTLVIWPVSLFCLALWATFRITQALGSTEAVTFAMLFSAINLIFYTKFLPGELDHHNLQLVLLLFALMGVMRRNLDRSGAVVAGLCIALSLSIGVELLPILAVLALGVSGLWVAFGAAERANATLFSASLALGLTANFLLTAPASAYVGGFCDALSTDIAAPVVLAALSLLLGATFFSQTPVLARLSVLGVLFGLVLIVTLTVYPACLSNPLDKIDPYLQEHWLSRVAEARGLAEMWQDEPGAFLAIFAPAFIGIGTGAMLIRSGANRAEWVLMTALIAATCAIAAYQLRGSIALTALVTFPIAVGVSRLATRAEATGNSVQKIAAIGLLLIAFGPLWVFATNYLTKEPPTSAATAQAGTTDAEPGAVAEAGDISDCFVADARSLLNDLPPGLISASSNLGAQILLQSPHSVLSAPYHRNQDGMIAQLRIARSQTDTEAHERMRALNVDYVATCDWDVEYQTAGGNSLQDERFFFRLTAGHRPDFLEIIPGDEDSPLTLFRVK